MSENFRSTTGGNSTWPPLPVVVPLVEEVAAAVVDEASVDAMVAPVVAAVKEVDAVTALVVAGRKKKNRMRN